MARSSAQLRVLRKLLHHVGISQGWSWLSRIHPADIAEAVDQLAARDRRRVIEALLKSPDASAALHQLPGGTLAQLLEHASDDRLAELLLRQPTSTGVFILSQLEPDRRQVVCALLPQPLSRSVGQLLGCAPGSAGAIMSPEVFRLPEHASCEDALAEIRRRAAELPSLFYLYVVDGAGKLTGVVSLRQLFLAEPATPVHAVMVRRPVAARLDDSQERVAELCSKYDLIALPVVDEDGHLAGMVTVDEVIDVVAQQATKQYYQVAGLDQTDRVFSPIVRTVRRRAGWTLVNLATALLASAVVGAFSGSITKLVALATFMPVVAGLGGNSGSQSLVVVVRGLVLHEIERGRAMRAILHQLAVGLLMGVTAGLLTGLAAYALEGSAALGVVLLLAMIINMALGALAGAAIPLLLKLLGQDPALGSGILVTGLTDSLGFLVFLGLGTWLLIPGG